MKVLNIYAAVPGRIVRRGRGGLGLADKDTTIVGFALSLLISALVFGTFSSALDLLESIRDRLGKP